MENLITWYNESLEYPCEIRAAWFHHRFTQIHPFQDGNGRVARALATLIFLKDDYFPLVIRDSDRTKYIASLESADNGNLNDLITLFTSLQKESILKALGIERDIQIKPGYTEVIKATAQVLQEKFRSTEPDYNLLETYTNKLQLLTKKKIDSFIEETRGIFENANLDLKT